MLTEYEQLQLTHTVRFWQALHAGLRITWLNIPGDHYPGFYWSGCLRGERVVECTYRSYPALDLKGHDHGKESTEAIG